MMFRFAAPLLLSLLLGVALWLAVAGRRRPPHVTYSMTSDLARLAGGGARVRVHLPRLLRAAALILLVFAAARPQFYNVSREVRSPGVDIVLCLDTSGSMQALDFTIGDEPVTRLDAVKSVVADFIEKRESDRIGLVVFGAEAFTQSPLTMDKGLLLELVDRMAVGMAGDTTAVGSAIAVGGKRLRDLDAKTRLLILLTDGRSNAGEIPPETAAEAVRALGVKIHTIGVGGRGPAPFRVNTPFGPRIVHENVELDEETLEKVARIGGGRYFRAADSQELAEIYDVIDQEEKTEATVKEFFHFRDLYPYLLLPAILLILVELILTATVWRVLP
ncbi:von Willebrand factor type A domain protein [uncultured Desulfatiglans sp.]|nr:von Willebrand factor type A domain protein [uncultured Desulfatiglans sp.]